MELRYFLNIIIESEIFDLRIMSIIMLVCLFRLLIRKRGPLQKIRAINSEAPLFIILDLIQHEIINAIDFMENYNGCAN
jgi:hypothetical protein